MKPAPRDWTMLCATLCLSVLAGCGEKPQAERPKIEVPPELKLDATSLAAVKDPKYAEYRTAVKELRTASLAVTEYLKSIGGRPRTEAEATRYRELADATSARKAVTTEIMGRSTWTEDDRKAMRAIFVVPDSEL